MNNLLSIASLSMAKAMQWMIGIIFALIFIWVSVAQAEPQLPQFDKQLHLGVASCASSQCHGSVTEVPDSNILGTEYAIWTRHDPHGKAYTTLFNAESRSIAAKLGLKNAHEADICLDCHSHNVKAEYQGPKHLIEDGVGCEACHGGSENWLTGHFSGNSHAENIASGMYPTDEPEARAKLCLSCHYGTENKFATHQIMGAGHPRISFELDTFLIRQPLHYVIDEDYLARKGERDQSVKRWAMGMMQAAERNMEVIDSLLMNDDSLYPEIGLFDCHACHHPFTENRWNPRPSLGGVRPGEVRLNDSSLLVTRAIADRADPDIGAKLGRQIAQLHSAATKSRQAVSIVTKEIRSTLVELRSKASTFAFNNDDSMMFLKSIVSMGIRGEFSDYAGAEQAVMAVDLLSYSLGLKDQSVASKIDKLYEIVKNDNAYVAPELAKEFGQLQNVLR